MNAPADKIMLLQGSIRRFHLASVLQFLAQNGTTGVLEVRDFEEYGFVYLVEGRVEAISLPVSDVKLGTRLLQAGYLTKEQLAEALSEDLLLAHDEKRLKPLGQRLVEKGFASEADVRQVMRRQVLDAVFELAHWQEGVFIYEETDQMPHFQVSIKGDVPTLLLDVRARIQEGERARKNGNGTHHEACYLCPLGEECTPAIKAKYLKKDVCLWRKLSATMDDDYSGSPWDSHQLGSSKDEAAEVEIQASIEW